MQERGTQGETFPLTVLRKGRKLKLFLFLIFFIFLSLSISAYSLELIDQIIAVVNGEIITQSELLLELHLLPSYGPNNPGLTREVLSYLIKKKIYLQEAKKQGITVSSRRVEKIIADKKKGMSNQEFERLLGVREISLEDYKTYLETEILIYELKHQKSKQIERGIRVDKEEITHFYLDLEQHLEEHKDDGEVKEFFELYKDELVHAGEVKIAQILVRGEGEADHILRRIKEGEDFSVLAKEFSLGQGAEKGAELGWINPRDLKSPLKKLIEGLEIYEAIKIKEEDFYRIIQLQDKKEISFSHYKDKIRQYLENKRTEESLREWFENLESKAEIKILTDLASEIR
jgi:peptidyl-prolyl cis-trans isomerase SurA